MQMWQGGETILSWAGAFLLGGSSYSSFNGGLGFMVLGFSGFGVRECQLFAFSFEVQHARIQAEEGCLGLCKLCLCTQCRVHDWTKKTCERCLKL